MLSIKNVRKSFGANQALDGVSLDIRAGEVRALLGANGAGKSTLVKILSGALKPDKGEIYLDGRIVSFVSPAEASEAGVASVYQELSLIPGLTVAENIMLGYWPIRKHVGIPMIDRSETLNRAQRTLEYLGRPIDLDIPVQKLSLSLQQIVEVAKALKEDPKVLILDEPTSALSKEEGDMLIKLVRRLANQGLAIIYISHRMDEIPRVADTLTVLRDGHVVGTLSVDEAPTERVVKMMVSDIRSEDGRELDLESPKDEVRLAVKGLSRGNAFKDVTFELHRGEILGIAGLMGSGRTELLRCIFGRDRPDSGSIEVDGQEVTNPTERSMIKAGVGLAPEDRRNAGLVLPLSVGANLLMAAYPRFVSHGITSPRREHTLGQEAVVQLGIKISSLNDPVKNLSGGNQQKVVIGKWMIAQSEILLLDEPMRGIDVNAKKQIYKVILDLARNGKSIIVVSSEIEDLFQVCHRIAILNRGKLISSVPTKDTDIHEVLALAIKEI